MIYDEEREEKMKKQNWQRERGKEKCNFTSRMIGSLLLHYLAHTEPWPIRLWENDEQYKLHRQGARSKEGEK